jgi:hypothetical protein
MVMEELIKEIIKTEEVVKKTTAYERKKRIKLYSELTTKMLRYKPGNYLKQ